METQAVATIEESAPITDAQYSVAPGLSYSALKDLAISPLRFWHLWINPERPVDEPTPAMQFGSAVHCAILEPRKFEKRYCQAFSASDYPGCLVTMDDLRAWLKERGLSAASKIKQDLIDRAIIFDSSVPILDVLRQRDEIDNAGKVQFKKETWLEIQGAVEALRNEPRLTELMAEGKPEAMVFATDPETGVLLKGKLDWMAPSCTVDIKTFSQMRGKSIDRTVRDAVWYEKYYQQAYWYTFLRSLQPNSPKKTQPFIFAFVESDAPHDTRLIQLNPRHDGESNLYWQRANVECRELIRTYARYWDAFGTKPWRTEQQVDPLVDQELPQQAF